MRLSRTVLALATGLSMTGAVVAPVASAEETSTTNACTIVSGTAQWGFKSSYRSYTAKLAQENDGQWTLNGVGESDQASRRKENYTFSFPIDGAASTLTVKDGAVSAASIATTGSVRIQAHDYYTLHPSTEKHDPLYVLDTTFANPSFSYDGEKSTVSIDYQSYYAPGVKMTDYGPDVLVPENLIKDHGVMGAVSGGQWVQDTADPTRWTYTTPAYKYQTDPQSTDSSLAGIDRFFLGSYDSSASVDPATITLTTAGNCAAATTTTTESAPSTHDGSSSSLGAGATIGVVAGILAALGVIGALVARALGIIRF